MILCGIKMFMGEFRMNGSIGSKSDIYVGLKSVHQWQTLGWHDIRQRYRRSVLGPLWFTFSTLVLVLVLGFLYSELLGQNIDDYLPYLGIGLVVWQFISTAANEACIVMIGSSHIIKQIPMPLTVHVCRMVWRNFIILMHSLPVVILLMLLFGHRMNWELLYLVPAMVILFLNAVWFGIVFSLLCARYRDVAPIIGNLFQVGFFLTPVMWKVKDLEGRAWIAEFNPFFHLIEIVRGPLLGSSISLSSWVWTISLLFIGFGMAQYLMIRCRNKVAYWV